MVPESPAGRVPRVLLDVIGLGTIGIGGNAQGLGAAGAVQWFPAPPLSLRLSGGALGGTVAKAAATTRYLIGTAGVAFHPLRARPGRPIGLALHADYLVVQQSMSRIASTTSSPAAYDRWLSGAQAVVEGDWLFVPDVEMVLGVGIADVFAPTHIIVQGAQVATLPAVRALAEAGLRIRF
jgi:hypothetical protein